MSIVINDKNVIDVYAQNKRVIQIYKGDVLVYQYNSGKKIDVTDYEYTLDAQGNLILTKYIGTHSDVINPNL